MDLARRVDDVNKAPGIRDKGRVEHRARQDTVTATKHDKKRSRMTLDRLLLCTVHDTIAFSRMIGSRAVSRLRVRANHCDDMELSLGSRFLPSARPFWRSTN